jgi:hypothetical protein
MLNGFHVVTVTEAASESEVPFLISFHHIIFTHDYFFTYMPRKNLFADTHFIPVDNKLHKNCHIVSAQHRMPPSQVLGNCVTDQ